MNSIDYDINHNDKGYNSGEVAGYEEGYIAGATENGIQWHDLRKNPNDLPKDDRDYLVFTEECGVEIRNYFTDTKGFSCRPSRMVLAWCEIPKFEV